MSNEVTALELRSSEIQLSSVAMDEGRMSMVKCRIRLRLLVIIHTTVTLVDEGELIIVGVGATGRSVGGCGLRKLIS